MSVNMLNYHKEKIDLPHKRKRTRMGMIYDPVNISGWWFGTFFIILYIGNNNPN
jgi:hypothetical protein